MPDVNLPTRPAPRDTPAPSLASRALYGLLFVAILPLALAIWAGETEVVVPRPVLHSPTFGVALCSAGLATMLAGFWALWHFGGGLPMNAFPPPRLVARGVYAWLSHPIYVGFGALCLGASLASGSSSGLWLVTPVTLLAMAALVIGYERIDLRRRFGAALPAARLALPPGGAERPTAWQRVSVYLLVLLPWAALYEAVQLLGAAPDSVDSHFAFERAWPVLEWTEAIYASAYLLVLLTPLIVADRATLRRFSLAGLLATAGVTLVYCAVPLVAPPRPFVPSTAFGRLLVQEIARDGPAGAFPSFHVLWVLLAAVAWPRRLRSLGFAWASLVVASCLTTGMHSLLDVLAAVALFPLFARYDRVWAAVRRATEALANSWREWRLGPLRIISHGVFIFLSAGVGMTWLALLLGPSALPALLLVCATTLVGAGLWAQWLEASSGLLRPFGFYGGLLGAVVGIVASGLLGYDAMRLLAAMSVATPWIQGLGRLRCLVQGCCHGHRASRAIGIRYRHSRSRVTAIPELAGVPVHPTPLYSILGNLVVGAATLRLWTLGASLALIAGLYFILSGLARFMEESYRGEPQTPAVLGLHAYHWLAIASVVGGAVVTTLDSGHAATALHPIGLATALAIVGAGLVAGLLMGVDFPGSNRRFSRLARADGPAVLLPLGDRDDPEADAEV